MNIIEDRIGSNPVAEVEVDLDREQIEKEATEFDAILRTPSIKEIVKALRESMEAWADNSTAMAVWDIRCHRAAIKLIQGMKEAA